MSIFSKLWAAIRKIVSKIFTFVKKILEKLWPLLLALAVIWFAPAIAGWLTTAGAPAWLSGAFSFIGTTVTPYLTSAASWLMSGAGSLFSGAAAVWSSLSMGTKASVVLGAATLLAPEEMADLAEEVGTVIGDTIGTAGSSLAAGFATSPLGMILIGASIWFLLSRSRDEDNSAQGAIDAS